MNLKLVRVSEEPARSCEQRRIPVWGLGNALLVSNKEMWHCWPVAASRGPMDATSANQIAVLLDDRASVSH